MFNTGETELCVYTLLSYTLHEQRCRGLAAFCVRISLPVAVRQVSVLCRIWPKIAAVAGTVKLSSSQPYMGKASTAVATRDVIQMVPNMFCIVFVKYPML